MDAPVCLLQYMDSNAVWEVKPQKCISEGSEELWFFMSQHRKNSVRGRVIDKKWFIRIGRLWGLQAGRQEGAAPRT